MSVTMRVKVKPGSEKRWNCEDLEQMSEKELLIEALLAIDAITEQIEEVGDEIDDLRDYIEEQQGQTK